MDSALDKEVHLGLDLNEEPMKGNGVDDRPTSIIKLSQAREYVQLLSSFAMDHSSEFIVAHVINIMDKLNKMSISNTNKHH